MKKVLLTFLGIVFAAGVAASGLPNANVTVSPSTGSTWTMFTIDFSDAMNVTGCRRGVEVRYKISSNRAWSNWSSSRKFTFKMADPGTHRLMAEVRDIETGRVRTALRTYRVLGSVSRHAAIRVSRPSVVVGQPVQFTLVLSNSSFTDPDAVQVRWNFDSETQPELVRRRVQTEIWDPKLMDYRKKWVSQKVVEAVSQWETGWSRQRTVTHVFDKPGTVSPSAEIKFPDGEILSVRGIIVGDSGTSRSNLRSDTHCTLRVLPAVLHQPQVNVAPGTIGYTESTEFIFTAINANIPRLGWMEWSVDGSKFKKHATQLRHRFSDPGTHEVRTRTCVGYHNPDCEETTTTVTVRRDPTDFSLELTAAGRQVQQLRGAESRGITHYQTVVGQRVQFVAHRRAVDSRAREFRYRWDFNGDGVWDTDFSKSSRAEHTYDRFGAWHVVMQAENEFNVRQKISRPITVAQNTFSVVYELKFDREQLVVGENISAWVESRDVQSPRTDLQARYDLDGDGNWDSDFRSLGRATWRFEKPGRYAAVVQVRDLGGKIDTFRQMLTVYQPGQPRARVKVSNRAGTTATRFTFDASGSVGRALQYFWDFNSDGRWDVTTAMAKMQGASGAKFAHTFSTPGQRKIRLRVVDSAGQRDEIVFDVTVTQAVASR